MFGRTATFFGFLVAGATAAAASGPAHERAETGQLPAVQANGQPRIIPIRAIEARLVPRMRGFSYLGPEYDARTGLYRLKFLRGQRVVMIEVDARTGEVIRTQDLP